MDTTSIIILLSSILVLLLLALFSNEINDFIERQLDQAAIYATEVQLLLGTLLGVILTELVDAMSTLDFVKVVIFGGIMVLIILAIFDIRRRSKYRKQWLDSQSMKSLTASIKDAIHQEFREDRKDRKHVIKQALREDRKERPKITIVPIRKSKKDKTKDEH